MSNQFISARNSKAPAPLAKTAVARALRLGFEKTRGNIERLADEPKACAWAEDGHYFAHPGGFYEISNWTTSFFTGMALLGWRHTGDEFFLKQAQRLAPHYRLKVYEHDRDTMHDLGFLYSLYSVALYQLTGEPMHRETGLRAARVLADRFERKGGYLRACGRMEEIDTAYAGMAIIDSMMNLPLLYWASAQTGEPEYRSTAVSHANSTLRYFLRPDDSVCHAYRFDLQTGAGRGVDNYCGYAKDSHWARGTAWAIYGFALSYSHTRKPEYLEVSLRLARQFLEQTAADPIPPWDFGLPEGTHPLRDSSAAAIAACGLQEIALHCPGDASVATEARRILARLCEPAYLDTDTNCPGLLRNAQVGNGTVGQALSVYASWGDYFFLEALNRELTGESVFWGNEAP
jgi:unsaturated chondroitin disaccharide hydrolase